MSKPTIVVVGLLPRQARELENRCGAVKLHCVESFRGRKARIPNGDHVVLVVKFLGHKWTHEAMRQFPRNHIHYHLGGVSELSHLVENIVAGRAVATHRRGVPT
jgi:hypothetical protein